MIHGCVRVWFSCVRVFPCVWPWLLVHVWLCVCPRACVCCCVLVTLCVCLAAVGTVCVLSVCVVGFVSADLRFWFWPVCCVRFWPRVYCFGRFCVYGCDMLLV